ncbi:DUF2188 domain-containing protein [Gracilibacillus caseinilyticus]|uniref:DUF2188 domain-containing protein n=1 Tax=Gracilibacillus caseinilyticus TaxID=2932256 RepID=A0ABY4EY14_9BACI|nr:DUF2188 domain-containing protein [Gracilibacillus caseinilyticus]UOQ49297.1 DUF2188 domain-containing protein [Gracilibacillus caseinilyticus]
MPWDTNDYPSSLKNLDTAVRKKAIDMANAMLDEGYPEDRAIPIATEQAKEWYENATREEINKMINSSDQQLRSHDNKTQSNRPELLDKGQHVVPHEDQWAVMTQDAKEPANVYQYKQDAIDRAKEIAKNKDTQVTIHRQDGSIQNKLQY